MSYVSLTKASIVVPLIKVLIEPDALLSLKKREWVLYEIFVFKWIRQGENVDISNICYWHFTVTHIKACSLISKCIFLRVLFGSVPAACSLIHCTLIRYWGAMAVRLRPVPAAQLPWATERDGWREMRGDEKFCARQSCRDLCLNIPSNPNTFRQTKHFRLVSSTPWAMKDIINMLICADQNV